MADDGIFATNAQIEMKCGANCSATSKAVGYTDVYISQVESFINTVTRYNWSDAYAGLNVDVKAMLQECATNLVAIYVIQYDMSGFTSRVEAEDMINILRDAALRTLALLRDKKTQDFMTGA